MSAGAGLGRGNGAGLVTRSADDDAVVRPVSGVAIVDAGALAVVEDGGADINGGDIGGGADRVTACVDAGGRSEFVFVGLLASERGAAGNDCCTTPRIVAAKVLSKSLTLASIKRCPSGEAF